MHATSTYSANAINNNHQSHNHNHQQSHQLHEPSSYTSSQFNQTPPNSFPGTSFEANMRLSDLTTASNVKPPPSSRLSETSHISYTIVTNAPDIDFEIVTPASEQHRLEESAITNRISYTVAKIEPDVDFDIATEASADNASVTNTTTNLPPTRNSLLTSILDSTSNLEKQSIDSKSHSTLTIDSHKPNKPIWDAWSLRIIQYSTITAFLMSWLMLWIIIIVDEITRNFSHCDGISRTVIRSLAFAPFGCFLRFYLSTLPYCVEFNKKYHFPLSTFLSNQIAVIVFMTLTIYAKTDCWVDASKAGILGSLSTVSTFFVDIYNLYTMENSTAAYRVYYTYRYTLTTFAVAIMFLQLFYLTAPA
jgi:fluoride ion exporter CrcB/FEX